MKVESLHAYPLKSGRDISAISFVTTERGFEGDRRFMVVDASGKFLTQRTHPMLGWVDVSRDNQSWHFRSESSAPLAVHLGGLKPVDVTVWSDDVRALDCGESAAEWFEKLLGEPTRLVYMPDEAQRLSDVLDPSDEVAVSFADACPYLLTTFESLVDLNSRIAGEEVPMLAFRPNVVLSGAEAWDEDTWREVHIGEARFDVVKPCLRCKITTLDPEHPRPRGRADGEPLRTLAKFRRDDGGEVKFGVYLVCRTPGVSVDLDAPIRIVR